MAFDVQACSLSPGAADLGGRIYFPRPSFSAAQWPGPEAPLSLNNFYGPSEAGIGATIYEEISSTSIN